MATNIHHYFECVIKSKGFSTVDVAIAQQEDIKPQEGLSPLRYGWNFTKKLAKDNRFWSRLGAVFSGGNLLAQGLVGGFFLLSAPIAAQVAGFVGCAALIGIGLTAIGMGFPGAWKRLEHLCTETFPKFNPLRKLREPFRARLKQEDPTAELQTKKRKGLLGRMIPQLSEDHKDIFLSGVTLEGAAVAGVGWTALVIAPALATFPAVTVGGALLLAWSSWCVGTCLFDIFNSAKTLSQAFRAHRRKGKDTKAQAKMAKMKTVAPPVQEAKSKHLPPATTKAFNDNTAPAKQEAAPSEAKPAAPAKRAANGPQQP